MAVLLGAITKTIATSPSIERMMKIVGEYYYSPNISLVPVSKNIYIVHNSKGVIQGVNVIKKGKRFVFQSI